jgi:hypothetical protein
MPKGAEQCPQRLRRPLVSPTTRVRQRPPAGSGHSRRSPKAAAPYALPLRTPPTCLRLRRRPLRSPCPGEVRSSARATALMQPRLCLPYPSLFDTSTSAPAKMRAAMMSVCPPAAAEMSAAYLPTSRLPARTAHSRGSRVYWLVPIVALEIEAGAGGNELLDHERVTLPRGQHECSAPARIGCRLGYRTASTAGYIGPYPSLVLRSRPAPAEMSCSTTSA